MRITIFGLKVAFGTGFNEGLKDALDASNNFLPQFENNMKIAGQYIGTAISEAVAGDASKFILLGEIIGEGIKVGLMTVLSKASNTDLDFSWVAQDDSNAIQNAIVDAKGDLISATAADTPARLASSAVNGDVLTVDTSTATGLKWSAPVSGGMTLISTTDMSGSSSFTLSSIPSTYEDILIIIRNAVTTTIERNTLLRFNADSTANRHFNFNTTTWIDGTSVTPNDTSIDSKIFTKNSGAGTDYNLGIYRIYDYANATTWKFIQGWLFQTNYNDKTQMRSQVIQGGYNQISAISSLQIFSASGNYNSGTIELWGIK